jgi:dUTPase
MCGLQPTIIPLRVGAKLPSNLDKPGAPLEFYAPTSISIPPLGASRIPVGLHVQLPERTELVLQTRTNFQRRGLTVTNPKMTERHELTILITNDSQMEQRISRGACLVRGVLRKAQPQ